MRKTVVILLICFGFVLPIQAETVLTVEKVRARALEYNRQLQSAQKELYRASGEIISTRSGALPQLNLEGRYTRNIEGQVFYFPDSTGEYQEVPISRNNDFNLALSFTQPLYVGGKVGSALKIAKIYKRYWEEIVSEIESEIVFGSESMFYAAILAESRLDALKSSYEQLKYNLEVVDKFNTQGMVSDFELLQAKVALSNLEPQLINAESQVNLSQKALKSFLGYPLEEEISTEADFSDTTISELPELRFLIQNAMQTRPKMKQATLQKEGYDRAVRIAKGDWLYPSLYINSTYQLSASSNKFRLDEYSSDNWTASLILNIPLFDGGRTIGEVRKAKTDYYQAELTEEQTKDDIRLEVEQAFDALSVAKKSLDVQKETINQAEEGLRIANLRYKTGVGTQLEILSAQTALTDARTNFSGAVYNFRLAKSALKKATGFEIQ